MVGVLQCKRAIEYLAQNKNDKMSELVLKKWGEIKEMVTILQIPYKATIAMQKKDLTLSDAWGIWLKTIMHLESPAINKLNKTNFSNCLLNALNVRKKTIFNNPVMLGAIYLDPRFQIQIIKDENLVKQAIDTLANVYHRIHSVRSSVPDESEVNDSNGSSGLNLSIDFNDANLLDSYLLSNQNSSMSQEMNASMSIETELELFQPEHLASDSSVIDFWKSNKQKYPMLYEIATAIYSIPPTECQIERDFSKLEFIFSQRRQKLAADTLEAILSIHLNPDLFFLIKKEELTETPEQNDESMEIL